MSWYNILSAYHHNEKTLTPLPTDTQLSDLIIRKIQTEGPISFHDFMEMSLYYPGLGYYNSMKEKIGTSGDFYTSPSLTSAFGYAIARQIEEMWNIIGEEKFTIVEFGAGTGLLCHDILSYFQKHTGLYNRLNYCIIEKSQEMRRQQQMHLSDKVSWYDSIRELPETTGCIFSNELVDNFSVHQVVMNDALMEVFVGYENGFVEIMKTAGKELNDYLQELNVQLPKGYRTEINIEAIRWIEETASCLRKGFVITIDYGYSTAEYYSQKRTSGTLVCYNKHRIYNDPYKDIGSQDITSFVNFSALAHWGSKTGLQFCGLIGQTDFLLALGFKELLRNQLQEQGKDLLEMVRYEAYLTRTLLLEMGSKFKVLIQQKGLPETALTGLGQNTISGPVNTEQL